MLITLDPNASSTGLGATFLAVMAFPETKRQGDQFAAAMMRGAGTVMANDPARFGKVPEELRLLLCGNDKIADDRIIRKGARIISNQRLLAAKAALPEFHAHLADRLAIPRPAIVPTHASREMIAAIAIDMENPRRPLDGRGCKPTLGSGGNSGNMIKHMWLPSMTTLHMALALRAVLEKHPSFAGLDGASFGDVLFDPELCHWLIYQSEIFRPVVAEKFGLRPQSQVSVCFRPWEA